MNVLKKKVISMAKSNMAQIFFSMAIMSIHENPYLNLQKSNSCLQGNHFLTKASLNFFPSLRTTLYRCISNRLFPKIRMSSLSFPTCQPSYLKRIHQISKFPNFPPYLLYPSWESIQNFIISLFLSNSHAPKSNIFNLQ